MKVNGKEIKALWYEDNLLKIIDQRKLPFKIEIFSAKTVDNIVFAIKEMGRFYRHVLIGKKFPHHTGVAFKHVGKTLFAAMKILGVQDVSFNQPEGMLYPDENPF